MNIACLFGHKWDGCKCTRCGIIREGYHDWDRCHGVCRKCGAKCPEQHMWNGCTCTHCGKTRDYDHDWKDGICTRCGAKLKTAPKAKSNSLDAKKPSETKLTNLVVFSARICEGTKAEGDDALIINSALGLVNRATNEQFMASPAFRELYQKYASLKLIDEILLDGESVEDWLSKKTGDSVQKITSQEWSRYFHMRGNDYIRDGVRIAFYVASYFY